MTAGRLAPPALLLALASPLLFYGLGSHGFVNGDEAFYHTVTRHMLASGDWTTLWFVGENRFYDALTHAPFFFWIKALVIRLAGDSYFTMRLPSAAAGLASLLATFALVRGMAGTRAGFLAGLVQLTTYQFVFLHGARTGEMEPLICLALTLAVIFFLRALETGRGFAAHHLCLAFLAGLKLPLIAIPLLADLAHFALHRPARARLRDWFVAATWVLPLGVLWHAYQVVTHREAVAGILEQLFLQVTRQRRAAYGAHLLSHLRYYGGHLLAGAFPYALFYPLAVAGVLRRATGWDRARWQAVAAYGGAVVAFYLAIQLRHPWYLLHAVPFLSAFTGAWLDGLLRDRPGRVGLALLASALAVAAWIRIPVFALNPFATPAYRTVVPVAWASAGPVGPGVGVPLLAVVLLVAGVLLARGPRPSALGAPVVAALVLVGSLRVVASLAHVSYLSPTESLHRELASARAKGAPIPYPVPVRERDDFKVRAYFGNDFSVVRASPARRAEGVYFLLHPKEAFR